MTTAGRFATLLAFSLYALLAVARAQTPQLSTVNVTPDEDRVRVSAVGDVLDMRVVVSDDAGDVVFEGGPLAGDKLDWTMADAQGRRLPPGTYTLTVSYRISSGKLRRRVEQVLVTEEVTAEPKQESAAPTSAAPVEGVGTTGRIAKFTTTNTVGNSVMFESSGKVGIGTTAPQQSLHAVGPNSRLRLQSTNGPALTTTEYVTNGRFWQSGAGGSTALNGVANKFFVLDQTANQFRLVIDAAGNLGIGTTAPAAKLAVNGGIQILGAGNGIRFPDGSIQTKATSGTISGTGVANRLAKFTGPNSFGNSSVADVSGKVGIGTVAPLSQLDVRGDLFVGLTAAPDFGPGHNSLFLSNDGGDPRNSFRLDAFQNTLSLVARSGANSTSGAAIAFRTAPAAGGEQDRMIIMPNGKVGIGTSDPVPKLDVVAGGGTFHALRGIAASDGFGVTGISSVGSGVHGDSSTGHGVSGSSGSQDLNTDRAAVYGSNINGGWAGYFQGPVKVTGTFSNNSDRGVKANITSVDPRTVLQKLATVPVQAWNYKTEGASVRHLGPMAQDFRAAFGLGVDEKSISAVDADGVALASIQALYQLLQEKDRQIEQQGRQLAEVRARLARVERAARQRRAAGRGR
ncbi:MAG TPA: tail fiber domain-containing protein [Pyrinomonadaceae bacterium]|nr:tail fiber domain-containing protein [Pyrinomonadaceae bacterium]